jgi:hypothetical protein
VQHSQNIRNRVISRRQTQKNSATKSRPAGHARKDPGLPPALSTLEQRLVVQVQSVNIAVYPIMETNCSTIARA